LDYFKGEAVRRQGVGSFGYNWRRGVVLGVKARVILIGY